MLSLEAVPLNVNPVVLFPVIKFKVVGSGAVVSYVKLNGAVFSDSFPAISVNDVLMLYVASLVIGSSIDKGETSPCVITWVATGVALSSINTLIV